MATIFRAQCYWQVGSMLPRDRFTITPHFQHQQIDIINPADWQALAEDLATGLKGWEMAPTAHELTVKLYKLDDEPPRRPVATVVKTANQSAQPTYMREVALCLSFNGGTNKPNERGRLYIPHVKCSNTAPAARPPQADRDKVAALVPIFSGLGGVNVDWGIYSPTKRAFTKAERYFVDDEWDVQRRRGDRPTARTAGTTGG